MKKNRLQPIEEKIQKLRDINRRVVKKTVYQLKINEEGYYEAVKVEGEDCLDCFRNLTDKDEGGTS